MYQTHAPCRSLIFNISSYRAETSSSHLWMNGSQYISEILFGSEHGFQRNTHLHTPAPMKWGDQISLSATTFVTIRANDAGCWRQLAQALRGNIVIFHYLWCHFDNGRWWRGLLIVCLSCKASCRTLTQDIYIYIYIYIKMSYGSSYE